MRVRDWEANMKRVIALIAISVGFVISSRALTTAYEESPLRVQCLMPTETADRCGRTTIGPKVPICRIVGTDPAPTAL